MYTYSMIDTPHENRQQWLISTEQLNLLSLDTNVFFLQLAESTLYYAHSDFELSQQSKQSKRVIGDCQKLIITTESGRIPSCLF